MVAGNVAAIDCGSLSTRLLVSSPTGATLERVMRLTGLGRGVGSSGTISKDAAANVLAALEEFRAVMDSYGVERAVMVGTSALRDAANRADFSQQAAAIVGTELRLLSGEEEACISFVGATRELPAASGPWLVADIGGGSTELAAGLALGDRQPLPKPGHLGASPARASWQPVVRSLDLGCVRVTERFFAHDPPGEHELIAARRWLGAQLRSAVGAVPALASANGLVGLAGTVAALACFDQGLSEYRREAVHHYVLKRSAVVTALTTLASLPAPERSGRSGIEPGRARYIVGGALILEALMGHFGFEECLVSEADILDGLVALLLDGCVAGSPVKEPG